MSLRSLAKKFCHFAGLEVHRRANGRHIDPFFDQKSLLAGRDAPTIFDLGANWGQTALEYREKFPKATIHCFEPFDENFQILSAKFQNDPGIHSHQLAVSESEGTRNFFVSENNQWCSLLVVESQAPEVMMVDKNILPRSETNVTSTTLDAFCAKHEISHIEILKMDIQGGELLALRGAAGLLEAQAIDLIYSEVLFADLYVDQAAFLDLHQLLEGYHYSLFGIYHMSFGKNDFLVAGDALWMSRRLRDSLG